MGEGGFKIWNCIKLDIKGKLASICDEGGVLVAEPAEESEEHVYQQLDSQVGHRVTS
jgi:hypothetical protein